MPPAHRHALAPALACLFLLLSAAAAQHAAAQPGGRPRATPIPIAQARENDTQGIPKLLNQTVTVTGIVTVANQFGIPGNLEDASGGIAVYDGAFADSVAIGDEVTISGKVTQYNGLTELTTVVILERISTGNAVQPAVVTIADLIGDGVNGLERYEGCLVQVNNVTVNTATWTVSGAGTNYQISDGAKQMDLRVDKDADFANRPAPSGSFDVVGVISQYQRTAPYVGGYQLMPRMQADIHSAGPRILSMPFETSIDAGSVTLEWGTALPARSTVRYWKDESVTLLGEVSGADAVTAHRVTLAGLEPATIYRAQAFSVAGTDTSFVQPMYVCTASATSTGAMRVFFNRGVDNALFPPVPAQGNVNLKFKLLDRIDSALHSIDAVFYSLSGAAGDDIAAALRSAAQRGVAVRVILEADNSSSAAVSALRASGIPVVFDTFDPVNAGSGLMHNKLLIVDARDRASDTDDWLVSGSWNATEQGLFQDAQNYIEIQDQALATIYTKEFDEMWGSSGAVPSAAASRFGARKTNNTPHQCQIGATRVEVFFCPSDRSSSYIVSRVRAATTSVYFAILTFTRDDIAAAMTGRLAAGRRVRGVMDNSSDQGSEFQYLQTAGVDVLLKKNIPGLLHHKYMVIDGDEMLPGADPVVITGSANWSTAAETANNENVLGIHSRIIAVLYLQEWFQRYKDAGGTGAVVLGGASAPSAPGAFAIASVAPNPAPPGGLLRVELTQAADGGPVDCALVDLLGRTVFSRSLGRLAPGASTVLLAPGDLPAGSYLLQLRDGAATAARIVTILR